MTHYMNLHQRPFEMVKSGLKTIELRLFDEKRQMIKTNDTIVFTNTNDIACRITATVKALHIFSSFDELYRALPLDKCGYLPQELSTACPKDMEKYYSAEKQKQYGVIGIELQLQ